MSWLNGPCLVLNKSWRPVNVISVPRAISMALGEKAVFIEGGTGITYGFKDWVRRGVVEGRPVRTATYSFDAPEVLVTRSTHRAKRRVPLTKRNIFARDSFRCQYCGARFGTTRLSIDHIIPQCQGGSRVWSNVVCACKECNVRKAGRTPKEAKMRLIKTEMKEPVWSPIYSKKTKRIPESWGNFVKFSQAELDWSADDAYN